MKRKVLVPMFASIAVLSASTISNADNVEEVKNNNIENDNTEKAIGLDEYKEEQYKIAIVKDGVAVKVREEGDVQKVAYTGDKLKVLATQGEWVEVSVDEETKGWVPKRYVDIENTKAYIVADKVNFRKENNTDSDIIKELEIGEDLKVLEVQEKWIKVKNGEEEGFVSDRFLSEEAPIIEEEEVIEEIPQDVVAVSNEVSRQQNNTSPAVSTEKPTSQPVSTQKPAEQQKPVEKSVEKPKEEVVQTSNSNSVQAVLNLAYSKQGSPYVWGAEGPNSFDCSGFTSYVFRNAVGVNLPRTSSSQSGYGQSVSKSELKPGDLVFFNTSGEGVSHVGIYIGNGNMIHAPSSGKSVSVASINSSYYSARFVNAKRVL